MKALITGASSGIGRSMAYYLAGLGYDLILVARDKEKLQELQDEISTDVKIIVADLTDEMKLKEIYVVCKNDDIDLLINNAGFGLCGEFDDLDLSKELSMIDVNIKALHTLTKFFLKDMKKRNKGYILNVASIAAFEAGPLMATYYATKAYVLRFSLALREELRREQSKVSISCLCPGPVDTNFNKVANVEFALKGLSSDYVAKYAIDKTLKRKAIIIPSLKMKLVCFATRLAPQTFVAKIVYRIQKKKIRGKDYEK